MRTLSVSISEELWDEIDSLHRAAEQAVQEVSPDSTVSKSKLVARWLMRGMKQKKKG